MRTETASRCETLRALLGSVVHRNAGRWLRFILTILKNEADAEDVLQEAVRRVLARNVSLESEDQVRMYLNRAIANAAFEFYNCRKRERLRQLSFNDRLPLPLHRSGPLFHMEDLEKSGEKERLLKLLDEGLTRLPSKQQEALRLTILESGELSIRHVCVAHGIPYSTLRHRSKQGLRRLRRFLEQNERNQKSGVRSQKSALPPALPD
jgi:RNA polymerase sigma factor (sigma-70 family)